MRPILALLIVVLGTYFSTIVFCHEFDKNRHHFETIVQGNNQFALKLLQFLGSSELHRNVNLFFSPTSISLALGMVFLGAKGESSVQISDSLNWSSSEREKVYSALKVLHQTVRSHEQERFELELANRIWGHQALRLEKAFINAIRKIYDTEITLKDFERDPERVRNEVNQWVHQRTNGKIKDFLAPGVINANTQLALVNAIYFKGLWKYKFNEKNTFHGPFYSFGNQENEDVVEMMSQTAKLNYFFDEKHNCRVLELPYSGDDASMMLILPEQLDGLSKLELSLTVGNLKRWTSLLTNTTVSVMLPKFKLNKEIDLKTVLPELGIRDIFDSSQANLTSISETDGLFVSHAIHKAHVEVNERGTEAAAATGIVMRKRSLDLNEIFHVDHPFIFLIRHYPSNSILFVGRVLESGGMKEQTNTRGQSSDEL